MLLNIYTYVSITKMSIFSFLLLQQVRFFHTLYGNTLYGKCIYSSMQYIYTYIVCINLYKKNLFLKTSYYLKNILIKAFSKTAILKKSKVYKILHIFFNKNN